MLCSLQSDQARSVRKARVERSTLADFGFNEENDLHIVGRLDRNSEGLLLLTTDGQFTHTVLESRQCHKRYWALVQGDPSESALQEMRRGGLDIRGYQTRPPVDVSRLASPQDDDVLSSLPTAALGMDRQGTWISVVLNEGRNKQVRRMTAAAGHPTIRLVRMAIGALSVGHMQPGEWGYIEKQEVTAIPLSDDD
jgi:23S rRNA pseudouridine2457 synthase